MSSERRGTRTKSFALAAAVLAIAAIGALALASNDSGRSASDRGTPAASATVQERTVLVSDGREPAPSAPGLVLNARRVAGALPAAAVQATVISDRDCAPDARGISRCVNSMRLPGGRILTVRHPHRMMDVPCLEPGERVQVRRA